MNIAGVEEVHLVSVLSSGDVSFKLSEGHGALAACVTIMT